MFDKILIANRGEIAVRIMKTARRMGIKTVAVYSDADINALHVKHADEAVYVGPPPANESYLNNKRLLHAIRKTGAQAVHPGYGFLSENADFAKILEKEGICFIGPSHDVIQRMGDKIEAKKTAQAAGVSTIPGYIGVIKSAKDAVSIAQDIGYPVMVKAAAGGGGKGMRIVHSDDEIDQAFTSASNEAKNSFSDSRIFIEKCIEKPRHIEIQLLADTHGNIVCLGERECSIQRHHQKVIEEAPSPFMNDKTRKAMMDQVISLAKEVNYYSAGTAEFIVDHKKNFYFLEVNTRLQVEHCVTELITGIDLVEQMIRVAAGEKLSFSQKDISINGWAMESRVYAEDPARGFLPSSGRITKYKEPEKSANVRIDSGVYEGGEVSMFYDPMIAKLSTHGANREEAITHMQAALGDFVIGGISHNISLLEAVMDHEDFKAGNFTTEFLSQTYPDGFSGAELSSEKERAFLAVAAYIYLEDIHRAAAITGKSRSRERYIGTRWVINIDDKAYPVYVRRREQGVDIRFEDEFLQLRTPWTLGDVLLQGQLNGKNISVKIAHFAGGFHLTHGGATVKVTVRSPRVSELGQYMPEDIDGDTQAVLKAPISGMVVTVKVKEGDTVEAHQDLVIIEAMKMENILSVPYNAVVESIFVKEGESCTTNQILIQFQEDNTHE